MDTHCVEGDFNPYQAGLFGQRIGLFVPQLATKSAEHGPKWKLTSFYMYTNLETHQIPQKNSKKYCQSDLVWFSAFGSKNLEIL